jgi:hypothetical protein
MRSGPGFLATFIYYFGGTALAFTVITAIALNVGVTSGISQQAGLLAGLIAGIIGGYFNRTMSASIPFRGKKVFMQQLNDALTQLGYIQMGEVEGALVYERLGLRKYLAGKVFVTIEDNTATIASRMIQVKTLKKLLPDG